MPVAPAAAAAHGETAVYFAGFQYERRAQLEALAADAGWQLRGGFSKSFYIMVAGTLAGSAQMTQAELGNIEVIAEQEFCARLHAENKTGNGYLPHPATVSWIDVLLKSADCVQFSPQSLLTLD